MKWCKTNRRHFLQGAGGALLWLPILPSLMSKKLLAQVMASPVQKNFVGFTLPFGGFTIKGTDNYLCPPPLLPRKTP